MDMHYAYHMKIFVKNFKQKNNFVREATILFII